jgi:hypothetical protein
MLALRRTRALPEVVSIRHFPFPSLFRWSKKVKLGAKEMVCRLRWPMKSVRWLRKPTFAGRLLIPHTTTLFVRWISDDAVQIAGCGTETPTFRFTPPESVFASPIIRAFFAMILFNISSNGHSAKCCPG